MCPVLLNNVMSPTVCIICIQWNGLDNYSAVTGNIIVKNNEHTDRVLISVLYRTLQADAEMHQSPEGLAKQHLKVCFNQHHQPTYIRIFRIDIEDIGEHVNSIDKRLLSLFHLFSSHSLLIGL